VNVRPSIVLGIAWLVVIVYAFPGQMPPDTFDHLDEARRGLYTDGHPPVNDLIFDVVDHIAPIPLALLVAATGGFLLGLYLIARRTLPPQRAAWVAAGLFVFPPVMTPMAAVWKDSLMAALLALGIAGMLADRRAYRLAGLAAMFGAAAVRYNAFAATFPLIVLLFEWERGMHWLARTGIALVAWVAITLGAFALNGALVDQKMYYWHSSLAVHDIAGTLANVDGELPDRELERLFEGTELVVHEHIHKRIRQAYTPKNYVPIVFGDTMLWKLPLVGHQPAPEPQRDAIARAWWEVLRTYPNAYAIHRATVMGNVLALTRRPAEAVLSRDFRYPQLPMFAGTGSRWSRLQLAMTSVLDALWKHTPLFSPWLYLAIALLFAPFALRHRDLIALLASGVLLESTLTVLAPTADYRYSHWMVVATCIAAVLLVARRYAAWLRPAATSQHSDASQASTQ
jgi:hypothetical protein